MAFWGKEKPRVYLKFPQYPLADGPETVIDLPDPAEIRPTYKAIYVDKKTRTGTIKRRKKGYRYQIQYTWTNVNEDDFANLVKVANWQEEILLMPHTDKNLLAYPVEVDEFDPGYPNNRSTPIDIVDITFTAIHVRKILDYDNIIWVQPGYTGVQDSWVTVPGVVEDGVETSFRLAMNNIRI